MADFAAVDIPFIPLTYGPVSTHQTLTFAVTSNPGVASITYYLMRGIVAGAPVYWYATLIDTLAQEYTGGGTPTNIQLVKRRQ